MKITENYYDNEQLKKLASKESLDFLKMKNELDEGRLVILGNRKNLEKEQFKPVLIGRMASPKICVAIGMDSNSKEHFDSEELNIILNAEPDVVCDVSIGKNICKALKNIRKNINVPLGSCPTYDIFTPGLKEELTKKEVLERIEEHLKAGVDFILLHFGINTEILNNMNSYDRVMPITSRGGGDIIRYMRKFKCENPLLVYAKDIGELCKRYGVVLDLGDIFRPGCLEDGARILESDSMKIQEVKILSELRKQYVMNGVSVVCEGGGHIPLNVISSYANWMKEALGEAPIWYNGPLPTDRAVTYDSIANAIGSCVCAEIEGGNMFLALTDAEHYTKPSPFQSAQAVRTMKVAMSAVKYAQGFGKEMEKNHLLGRYRQKRNWKKQIEYSLYPNLTSKAFQEIGLLEESKPCSLCGAHCPLLVYDKKE